MQTLKPKTGIPIEIYVKNLEEGAMEQALNCAQLPHAFHHIALMPDAHQGFAMPVGGVMALKGAVMPNAVGVDIGCGMVAARTHLNEMVVRKNLVELADEIMHVIPLGFEKHSRPQSGEIVERIQSRGSDKKRMKNEMPMVTEHQDEVPYQLGTLGGGNHFIEIQLDQEGIVWLMLHSGSRNIGLKIANHYHNIAKDYCTSINSPLPKDYAYLPLDLPEAQQYLSEMQWAMDFAMQNRLHMLNRVLHAFTDVLGQRVEKTLEVCTHHNYAAWEKHYGENVLVHRKGAVRACEGELVTIPGSMGTSSYIARGKGYTSSFKSCSHGAGRVMGRNQAKKEFTMDTFKKQMGDVYIATPKMKSIIDEAPKAYKDIEDVMDQQQYMVDRVFHLKPLAVVKG